MQELSFDSQLFCSTRVIIPRPSERIRLQMVLAAVSECSSFWATWRDTWLWWPSSLYRKVDSNEKRHGSKGSLLENGFSERPPSTQANASLGRFRFFCALSNWHPKFEIRGLSLGWPRQFVFLQIHQANCCWMGDSRPHPSWFTSSQSWLHLTIGWLLFGWHTPQQGQGTVRRMTFSQSRTELAPPG